MKINDTSQSELVSPFLKSFFFKTQFLKIPKFRATIEHLKSFFMCLVASQNIYTV